MAKSRSQSLLGAVYSRTSPLETLGFAPGHVLRAATAQSPSPGLPTEASSSGVFEKATREQRPERNQLFRNSVGRRTCRRATSQQADSEPPSGEDTPRDDAWVLERLSLGATAAGGPVAAAARGGLRHLPVAAAGVRQRARYAGQWAALRARLPDFLPNLP